MKKNLFSRLLSTALIAALLLPSLSFAPVKANGWTLELWKWESPSNVNNIYDHINMFNSNVRNGSGVRSRAFMLRTSKNFYTENGPESLASFAFRTQVAVSNGLYDGLPHVSHGTQNYIAENLHFDLGSIESMYTRGLEALNLDFTFVFGESGLSGLIPFNRELEVYVSVDGTTWLPDCVGMRSSKLLGGGNYNNADGSFVAYEVQTENLFDIEGFEPGDVVRGIRVLPSGKTGSHSGLTIVKDITLNGFETMEDWETSVPEANIPTVTIDPDILRQIVVDEGVRTATIPWTTDTIIDLTAPEGSSATATAFSTKQYLPGIQYQGPVYSRTLDSTREQLFASIVDGKHTSGFANDTTVGMDCQTFGFNALSRVSRTSADSCAGMPNGSGMYRLGNLKVTSHIPRLTNLHIIDLNSEQTVYEAYALARGGDCLDEYKQTGNSVSPHVRPIRDVIVVRNPDGTINGEESYMICHESMGTIAYEVEHADGKVVRVKANDPADLYAHLDAYPGSKVLYGHSAYADAQYTFSELYKATYVAFSLDVYKDGVVELPNVEMIFSPKAVDSTIEESGFHLTAASNYRFIDRTIKLEDLATGTVLFEDFDMPSAKYNSAQFNYENEELDNLLMGLTNGSYRLSVTVSSGPLTAIGQTKVPTTTKNYDFTITDKEPAATVSLSIPSSAAQGQTVQIAVAADGAFDAADVQVKVDSELLTFANGTLTPANAFGQITADKGIVSIVAVDAGVTSANQLAVLNFTAKTDIANVSKVVQLKSAQLITAEDANAGSSNKAMAGANACASVNFADVAQSAWYHDAVDYALENGIMGGYNSSTFAPNDKLSRAMVVQVLFNNEGQPTIVDSHAFPDVKGDDWFNNAVAWANINKIVDGYGNGTFQPNKDVSLEEIAVILWNYSGKPTATGNAASLGTHSDWAANALSWAEANGIFEDVPYTAVTDTATRGQTAQMLMNFLYE